MSASFRTPHNSCYAEFYIKKRTGCSSAIPRLVRPRPSSTPSSRTAACRTSTRWNTCWTCCPGSRTIRRTGSANCCHALGNRPATNGLQRNLDRSRSTWPGARHPPRLVQVRRLRNTTAPKRKHPAGRQKNPPNCETVGRVNSLATTYSHAAFHRTTIGATAFHFRVRDGTGWCHCAMVTRIPPRSTLRNRTLATV